MKLGSQYSDVLRAHDLLEKRQDLVPYLNLEKFDLKTNLEGKILP